MAGCKKADRSLDFSTIQLKEILVPVDGSQASREALALACLLARRNKGRVYAVYVVEVARTLPLDADLSPEARRGEEVLARAEEVADSLDFEVTGELLQARDAGHAIVDEAIERDVDGILLGMEYEKPLGEFQVGRTSQYVLRHAPCQVVLCRSAVGGTAE
jgi:nucleotide-binding universal stress UspA family protein